MRVWTVGDLLGCSIYLSCCMALWGSKAEESSGEKTSFLIGGAHLPPDVGCAAHVQSSGRCACHGPTASLKFTGQHTL